MTRARWTREELRGHRLEWLVDITFAGRTWRLSTAALLVVDADGTSLQYISALDGVTWSRSLDLFSLQPEPESIIVSGFVPTDVAELVSQGHPLEGAAVQVSQVRVRARASAGAATAVDTYDARRVCLSGRAVDTEYGAAGDQGAYVRFSAERNLYDSTTQVPPTAWRVTEDTWATQGKIAAADEDAYYPIVIGYPGRDDTHPDGWIPGSIGIWLNKQRNYNVLAIAVGTVEAETVWLSTDDHPWGKEVNVRYTYSTSSTVTVESRDALGTLLAVIDYQQDDYGDGMASDLGSSYHPAVDDDAQVFVGWPAGSGGMLWRGRVLRDAGDVLEWAMEQAGIPVDLAAFAAARPQLAWCKVDTVIDDAVNPVEWVTRELLPLLPVSMTVSDRGVAPWVWNPNAGRQDAVCTLDGDLDPRLDFADTVKCDASNVANRIVLRYAYDQRATKYTHTARVGPVRVAPTAKAKAVLKSTDLGSVGIKRVTVYARAGGADGAGIEVTLTEGTPLSVTDGTRSVAITYEAGVDDSLTIQAAINATSALISAETNDDSGENWAGPASQTVTLKLGGFGMAQSAVCARSRTIFAAADLPGPNSGIRERTLETRLVYDHGTAARITELQGAAYALPHRRGELLAPEADYGWLSLGDTVLVTKVELGLDEDIATVERFDHYSDGTVGIGFVVVDTAARPGVG